MSTTSRRSRDWSSLPALALFDIATRLNPIEFAALAGVCKSWRTICNQNKTQVNGRQPPLLLVLNFEGEMFHRHRTAPALSVCSFPDKRVYCKPLPPHLIVDNLIDEYHGFSHGYILFTTYDIDSNWLGRRVCLLNPFTEDLILMPPLAYPQHLKAVLTAPPGTPDSVVVALSWDRIMTCRPGVDDRWTALPCELREGTEFIHRAVFFKGRLYVLRKHVLPKYEVITIEIELGKSVKIMGAFCIKDSIERYMSPNSQLCFVVGEDELFALKLEMDKHLERTSQVYRLEDPEQGNWELVQDLGGRTLFATSCFGFVPSGAPLFGWEEGWEDSVFFAYPFCNIQLDGTFGPFLLENELGSSRRLFPSRYNYGGWVPPSYFCCSG